MRIRALCIVGLLLSCTLRAQQWEPIGADSFESIADVADGSLVLIRYPGDILRSSDSGETWCVVFQGHARLDGFEPREGSTSSLPREASQEGELVAFGDSGHAVVSRDSGRTWSIEEGFQHIASNIQPPALPQLEKAEDDEVEGEQVHSYAKIGSKWYAVGEPGLIARYDSLKRRWETLHCAPYGEGPFGNGSADSLPAHLDFASPAFGAISLGNQIYFTGDSGCTWRPSALPDSSTISSFFFIDDTCTLAGMQDGKLYSCSRSNPAWALDTEIQNSRPILQIGWQDAYARQLFVLTDSELFTIGADLSIATSSPLPLRAGVRALHASFPNSYVGFLLTDSTTRTDTIDVNGGDTTIIHDTSFIYRSLDGGGTWSIVQKNIPGLTNFCSPSVRIGYACGENGLILISYDSGSNWNRIRTGSKQTLRDIRFINDSVGYAVGDSGTVLFTYSYGKYWRGHSPEPLFFDPSERYTGIAFPNKDKVWIAGGTKGYAASIRVPAAWRFNRHVRSRVNLSVALWPNPASGTLSVDIRLMGTVPPYATMPTVKLCDLSGSVISEVPSVSEASTSEWTVRMDISFLRPGAYTIIASLGGQNAIAKFVKE
ncbi:MAG TPA: hypothetical protein VGM92_05605 [Candidatus Kapabacteria bacterium]